MCKIIINLVTVMWNEYCVTFDLLLWGGGGGGNKLCPKQTETKTHNMIFFAGD